MAVLQRGDMRQAAIPPKGHLQTTAQTAGGTSIDVRHQASQAAGALLNVWPSAEDEGLGQERIGD